jgi:hypothetical protein
MSKQDLKALSTNELKAALTALGEPTYRAEQIRHALYSQDVREIDANDHAAESLAGKAVGGVFYFAPKPSARPRFSGEEKMRKRSNCCMSSRMARKLKPC